MPPQSQSGLAWLTYALMTVAAWGVYGVFLHSGQMEMKDPAMGRYKAFLFVGIAYFLTAVLAPLAILRLKARRDLHGRRGRLVARGRHRRRDRRVRRAAGLRGRRPTGRGDDHRLRRQCRSSMPSSPC